MDWMGLLWDGVGQGLLYAPATMVLALLYAHAREIDVSLDGAIIIGGITFGLALKAGVPVLGAWAAGITGGAAVTLVVAFISLLLEVPFILAGIVTSFLTGALSTYLVGERLSLLEEPRIFVDPPGLLSFLWLPAAGAVVLYPVWQRLWRRVRTRNSPAAFWIGPLPALLILCGLALVGGFLGGRVLSLHIGLLFSAVTWWIVRTFDRSDLGLASQASGINPAFRLTTSSRWVRTASLGLVGIVAGASGVLLAQYKAQASSGGSFHVVVSALAAFLLVDRLAVAAGRRRDRLYIAGVRTGLWPRLLDGLARSNVASRALVGSCLFFILTQFVIALVRNPELPRLFIGAFLILVLGDWHSLGGRLADGLRRRRNPKVDVRGPETVRLEKVSKGFYRGRSLLPVLDGTDLVVAPGDSVVRIRGPNAAGKTTLFRVIDGSLRPDSGRCFILGREVTSFPRELRPVYRITQNPFETVAGTLTVRENLRLAAAAGYSLWRRLKPEDRQAAELLEQLGLEEVVTRGTSDGVETLAANLSGGQAQCLAFAMAMAAEPKVILADEPTANLDPVNADVILKLIERVSRRIPIVLVSHDERVSGLADKSLLLSAGRLIEEVGNADRGESRGTV